MRGRGRGRGPARGAGAAPRGAPARTRRGDLYEAEEARDPRARRAEASAAPDDAAALEELPEDFDDEEIDEDAAFTAADKAKWGDLDEYAGGGGGGSDDDGDGDDDDDIEWEDGEGDMLEQLEAAAGAERGARRVRRLRARRLGGAAPRPAASRPRSHRVPAQGAPAADVDEFLGGGSDDDDDDDDDDDALGAGGDASRRHAVMLQAAGVGAATRKRKLAKARPSRGAAARRDGCGG